MNLIGWDRRRKEKRRDERRDTGKIRKGNRDSIRYNLLLCIIEDPWHLRT